MTLPGQNESLASSIPGTFYPPGLAAVSTDSTLTGDGTAGNPLHVVASAGPTNYGAPTPRANSWGLVDTNAATATIAYGPDLQLSDGLILLVAANVSSTPTATGATVVAGPTRVGGASSWNTVMFVPPGTARPATVAVATASNINCQAFGFVPGTRGNIAVDATSIDTSPTCAIGTFTTNAGASPTQAHPTIVLWFLGINFGGTVWQTLEPELSAGTPINSPTFTPITTFSPFGLLKSTYSQCFAAYLPGASTLGQTINVPIIVPNIGSFSGVVQSCNLY
jgi:hypothetical protein